MDAYPYPCLCELSLDLFYDISKLKHTQVWFTFITMELSSSSDAFDVRQKNDDQTARLRGQVSKTVEWSVLWPGSSTLISHWIHVASKMSLIPPQKNNTFQNKQINKHAKHSNKSNILFEQMLKIHQNILQLILYFQNVLVLEWIIVNAWDLFWILGEPRKHIPRVSLEKISLSYPILAKEIRGFLVFIQDFIEKYERTFVEPGHNHCLYIYTYIYA